MRQGRVQRIPLAFCSDHVNGGHAGAGQQASGEVSGMTSNSRKMPGGAGNCDDDLHDWPSFIGALNSSDWSEAG